ncbi:MAG: hypothetical protein WA918_07565 [Erythrobacter sp.]
MSRVWMSSVISNYVVGQRGGLWTKYYGREWGRPIVGGSSEPEEVYQAMNRNAMGFRIERTEFPEASAVLDEEAFKQGTDIFWESGFFVVTGKLAELLADFDFGEGGGLVPYPIYQADLEALYPGEYFLLNFACRKDTVLIDQCEDAKEFLVFKQTGTQSYHLNRAKPKGKVVLSSAALEGPDIWFEDAAYNKLFVSDELVEALQSIGMDEVFRLLDCVVVGDSA